MSKISWRQILPFALAAFFVVGSLSNIFAPGSIYGEYLKWGYPRWFHFVTGSLELTGCHSALPGAESPVGLGARLHCHVCRHRDRHHPWRIRTRRAATRRGDIVARGRLDKLAQADGASRTGLMQGSAFRALSPAATKQASNGRYRAT
ncbi:DoxX family protein [Rhodanobacter umsongensis]